LPNPNSDWSYDYLVKTLSEDGSTNPIEPNRTEFERDVRNIYGLPEKVEFCTKCVVSNQRPRIGFKNGVCSACDYSEKKTAIDWEKRDEELGALLEKYRSKDGSFDVVVPCSGGKDGGFVAHMLQENYGMNVLAATWAPLSPTNIGRANLESFIASGFNHVMGTPNPKITRKLCRESLVEIGDPFQPFIYGQTNFPVSIAKHYGVGLIMYGENGEVEYGGDMTHSESPLKSTSNEDKHYFSGRPLAFWLDKGFSESDLALFMPSSDTAEPEQHFFGYYKKWDPQENFYYAVQNLGFTPNPERSEGTYSKYASLDDKFDGFHYFLGFLKFGIGRCTSDAAHEVRDGKISRDEAVSLVKKYDGEFPQKNFTEFLSFTGLSEEEFWKYSDSWRAPHIWNRNPGESWKLTKSVY